VFSVVLNNSSIGAAVELRDSPQKWLYSIYTHTSPLFPSLFENELECYLNVRSNVNIGQSIDSLEQDNDDKLIVVSYLQSVTIESSNKHIVSVKQTQSRQTTHANNTTHSFGSIPLAARGSDSLCA